MTETTADEPRDPPNSELGAMAAVVGPAFAGLLVAAVLAVLAALGWVGVLFRRHAHLSPLPLVTDALGAAIIVVAVVGIVLLAAAVSEAAVEAVREWRDA